MSDSSSTINSRGNVLKIVDGPDSWEPIAQSLFSLPTGHLQTRKSPAVRFVFENESGERSDMDILITLVENCETEGGLFHLVGFCFFPKNLAGKLSGEYDLKKKTVSFHYR